MTDLKNDLDADVDQNCSLSSATDPKNMQELTIYVSGKIVSQILMHEIQSCLFNVVLQVQTLLQNVQDKFQTMSDQIIGRIDDMGNRIDDLEKSIADLMNQAGIEGAEK